MRGFVNDSNLYSEYYVPRLFSLMKNHISKNEKNHTKYLAHCAIDMIKSCHSLQFDNAFFMIVLRSKGRARLEIIREKEDKVQISLSRQKCMKGSICPRKIPLFH